MGIKRKASLTRKTKETDIKVMLELDGSGDNEIDTGIPFFDHMLTLFSVHGFINLRIAAKGDLEVDAHHTVEDVGLVLGEAFSEALGDRKRIRRYGHAVTPMDESLTSVTVDYSNRPFLVYRVPEIAESKGPFGIQLAEEFFRAVCNKGGLNLHVNVHYGKNEHHIIESIFKSFGRAMGQAALIDERITQVRSSKGSI